MLTFLGDKEGTNGGPGGGFICICDVLIFCKKKEEGIKVSKVIPCKLYVVDVCSDLAFLDRLSAPLDHSWQRKLFCLENLSLDRHRAERPESLAKMLLEC